MGVRFNCRVKWGGATYYYCETLGDAEILQQALQEWGADNRKTRIQVRNDARGWHDYGVHSTTGDRIQAIRTIV